MRYLHGQELVIGIAIGFVSSLATIVGESSMSLGLHTYKFVSLRKSYILVICISCHHSFPPYTHPRPRRPPHGLFQALAPFDTDLLKRILFLQHPAPWHKLQLPPPDSIHRLADQSRWVARRNSTLQMAPGQAADQICFTASANSTHPTPPLQISQ